MIKAQGKQEEECKHEWVFKNKTQELKAAYGGYPTFVETRDHYFCNKCLKQSRR